MKVPAELFTSANYDGVMQGLLDGELDAAGLGAAGYAGVDLRNPDAVEPVVTVQQLDGSLGYHSVLFVRADSPYQTLDDLRGRSLMFTDRDFDLRLPGAAPRAQPQRLSAALFRQLRL